MSLHSLLTQTVTLQRQTVGKDILAGSTRTWADVAGMTDVPAAIQDASAAIRLQYTQRLDVTPKTIFTDVDIGAGAKDRLTSGNRIFNVTGSTSDRTGLGRVFETQCEEVAGPG